MVDPRAPGWREVLHLGGLGALAVGQPALAAIAANPEFLVAHHAGATDVVLLAVVATVGIPAIVALGALLAGRARPHLGWAAYVAGVGVFSTLVVLAALRPTPLAAAAVAPLALGAGSLIGWQAARRAPSTRLFLAVLGAAVLLVPGAFLAHPDVRARLLPPAVANDFGPAESDTPLVLVVLDELPLGSLLATDGRIDAGRLPNFANLANISTWYRNTTSVASTTFKAVPALVTGRVSHRSRTPTSRAHPANLFTWLGGTYSLDVVEAGTELCPPSLCPPSRSYPFAVRAQRLVRDVPVVWAHTVLPAALAGGLPAIDQGWGDFQEPTRRRRRMAREIHLLDRHEVFRASLGRIRRSRPRERPPLHYIHVTLPHRPWQHYPSGTRYVRDPVLDGLGRDGVWTRAPGVVTQALQRHLLQVELVDRLLGELLVRLEAEDLLASALLVVVADHGVGFVPGESIRRLEQRNREDLLRVPLFVKLPGQRAGRVDDRDATSVDVLPTIAEALGIELPWQVDGRSLLDPASLARRAHKSAWESDGQEHNLPSVLPPGRPAPLALMSALALARPGGVHALRGQPRLIGRETTPFAAADRSIEVLVANVEELDDVELASGFVPGLIQGTVAGSAFATAPTLAVAIGGRVQATTRAVSSRGAWRFTALVPEASFVEGRNEVEVFAVEGTRRRPRLFRLRLVR